MTIRHWNKKKDVIHSRSRSSQKKVWRRKTNKINANNHSKNCIVLWLESDLMFNNILICNLNPIELKCDDWNLRWAWRMINAASQDWQEWTSMNLSWKERLQTSTHIDVRFDFSTHLYWPSFSAHAIFYLRTKFCQSYVSTRCAHVLTVA